MTTANLRIVHSNFADEATLTASQSATNFPASNVQTTRRDEVHRTTSTTDLVYTLHWGGENRKIGFAGVFNHLCQGCSWKLELCSDQAATTVVLDVFGGTAAIATNLSIGSHVWGGNSSAQEATDLFYYEQPAFTWFAPTTCKAVKVTISGSPSNGNSYFEVGRLFLGAYYELTRNPAYGVGLADADNDLRSRTLGGSSLRQAGPRWPVLTFDLDQITATERAIVRDIIARCQRSGDAVVSVFPGKGDRDERDYTINGSFASADPLVIAGISRVSRKWTFEGN